MSWVRMETVGSEIGIWLAGWLLNRRDVGSFARVDMSMNGQGSGGFFRMNLNRIFCRFAVLMCFASVAVASPLRDAGLLYPEDHFPELEKLLDLATRDSARVELLRARVLEQEGEQAIAASMRRLRMDANLRVLGGYEVRSDIDNRFRSTVQGSMQVVQPLYHWNRLKNMEAIGAQRVELAEIEFERGGREHLGEIRRSYLFWILAGERVGILRQTIGLAQTLVDNERRLLEIGRSTENSVLEMEARLLERQELLAGVERERNRYGRQLAQLVSVPNVDEALEGGPIPEFKILDLNGLEMLERRLSALGINQSPEVRYQISMQEIERKRYDIAARNRYPSIDFVAGLFSDQLEALDQDDFAWRLQFFAGVQFNWNIFDGRRTQGEKLASGARRRVHEIQEEIAREQLGAEAAEMIAEAELAIKKLDVQQTRAQILGDRLRLLDEQTERELASPLDRLEARLEHEDVRLRLVESRIQYLLAMMRLAAMHVPDPHLSTSNR